jgi:hypothetical protein
VPGELSDGITIGTAHSIGIGGAAGTLALLPRVECAASPHDKEVGASRGGDSTQIGEPNKNHHHRPEPTTRLSLAKNKGSPFSGVDDEDWFQDATEMYQTMVSI